MTAIGRARWDDHLDLLGRSLSDRRLVVFTGVSGSGKSTCIDLLLSRHPDFVRRPHTRIGPAPIRWPGERPPTELVVVDEVQRLTEVAALVRLLRLRHSLVVASHLPGWLPRALGRVWPTASFTTDRDPAKLERSLRARGVGFTRERMIEFVREYGASYTDLEIVLERHAGHDFDVAFERFQRSATIRREVGQRAR